MRRPTVQQTEPHFAVGFSPTAAQAADGLDGIVFEALGPAVIKGIPSPIPLYRALREGVA